MSVAQITDAINASRKPGSSKGVSREAIKKFIGDKSTAARINNTLKNAVKAKTLIQVKGSYKVAPVAKKVKKVKKAKVVKAKKVKVVKAKKAAAPKAAATKTGGKAKKAAAPKAKKAAAPKVKKAAAPKAKKAAAPKK